MKKLLIVLLLLYAAGFPIPAISAPCPPNNPLSVNAITVQGPDPTGNQGYPISVVSACPLDVSITDAILLNACVTQCTSPWIVGFGGIAQPISGTVTVNQGTSPWITSFNGVAQPVSGTVTVSNPTSSCVTQCSDPWKVDSSDIAQTSTISNPNDTVVFDAQGYSVVSMQVTGTLTAGTVKFKLSNDNITFIPNPFAYNVSNSNQSTTQIDTTGALPNMYCLPTMGGRYVILVADGSFAGALTIKFRATLGSSITTPNTTVGYRLAGGGGFLLGNFFDSGALESGRHGLTVFPMVQVPNDTVNTGGWVVPRTPNRFKTVQATAAGNTALWTPPAGKKFRLMRYMVTFTDNATQAAPGVITMSLQDGAADIGTAQDVFVPAAALVNSGSLYISPWIDLGNGYLSTTANNVLNINLSAALLTGNCRVMCCGTEE